MHSNGTLPFSLFSLVLFYHSECSQAYPKGELHAMLEPERGANGTNVGNLYAVEGQSWNISVQSISKARGLSG